MTHIDEVPPETKAPAPAQGREKKLPAREVHRMMRSLSEKHSKTSKNFWN